MISANKHLHAWLALTALAVGSGCNDGSVGATGSTTEAKVSGIVMILGKPATEGEVVFDPANTNRRDATARRVPIGKDGRYSVTTLIGANMAVVEGPTISKNGLTVANRQSVEIASGENTIDLNVPSTPGSNGPAARKPGGH